MKIFFLTCFNTLIVVFCFSQIKIDSLKKDFNKKNKISTLIEISDYYRASNFDSSLFYLFEAEKISKSLKNNDLDTINFLIGDRYYLQNQFLEALQYINLSAKSKNKKISSVSLKKLGSIYYNISDYEKSLKYYLEAIKLFEELNDIKSINYTYNNIANIYVKLEKFDKAKFYYNKFLQYSYEIKDSLYIFTSLNNLGALYRFCDKNDTAIVYYEKSILYLRKNDNLSLFITSKLNLAELKMSNNELINVKSYLNDCEKYLKDIQDSAVFVEFYIQSAHYYFQTKEYYKSVDFLIKALKISENNSFLSQKVFLLKQIADVYYKLDDFYNTTSYLIKYISAKDSIINLEKLSIIENLSIKYETEQKEKELEIKEKEIILLNKNLQIKSLIFIILISFILLISIMFFFLYKRKNYKIKISEAINEKLKTEVEVNNLKNIQINNELEKKKVHFASFSLYLNQKLDFITLIKKDLFSLKRKLANPEQNSMINNIINVIDIDAEINKKQIIELQSNFDNINKLFFENLLSKFPDLTQNEIKLCSLIKLGFSTSEISVLTNKSAKSVEMMRYRLRKKINIPSDIDILDFLNNF